MMEVTPHLKTVLKNYQHSATKSLQGPGLSLIPTKTESPDSKDDLDFIQPQPFPIQQLPILTSADKTCSERSETILENQTISCFVVGGEKRLCLPQVLNSVLREFTLQQINHECDNLQIYCSRCTPEQLNVLKSQGVLPSSAPSCGLITKTDAERLCSALLHLRTADVAPTVRPKKSALNFMVYHECFGKCRGVCVPEMYTAKTARCVECIDCHGWFSPQQFVCHVHRDLENRTVHWGFDSCNWRAYVLVDEDQIDHEQYGKYLDEMKDQFEGKTPFPQPEWNITNLKRKLVHHDPAEMLIKQEVVDIPLKKNKLDEFIPLPYNLQQLYSIDPLYLQYFHEQCLGPHRPLSAFKPFGHSLKETKLRQTIALINNRYPPDPPPVLQNPDRVVPTSQSEHLENSYQPNVALAPPTPKKHRYIKASEQVEKNEVTSSVQKESPKSAIVKVEKVESDHKNIMQKSPDSQTVDSTVSVVQSTGNLTRYNSEIELSTDTDDSASISSDKQLCTDVNKIEDHLKSVDIDTRDVVLKLVRNMAKEHEITLHEIREKDNKIRELEHKLLELEKRLNGRCTTPMVNGVCDTHNFSSEGAARGASLTPPTIAAGGRLKPPMTTPPPLPSPETPTDKKTPPPPPSELLDSSNDPEAADSSVTNHREAEPTASVGVVATSSTPASSPPSSSSAAAEHKKSVITALESEAIKTPTPE